MVVVRYQVSISECGMASSVILAIILDNVARAAFQSFMVESFFLMGTKRMYSCLFKQEKEAIEEEVYLGTLES